MGIGARVESALDMSDVANFAELKGRTDDAGRLLIVKGTAGTPGPIRNLANHRGATEDVTGYVLTAEQAAGTPSTSRAPMFNARGRVDEHHALQVAYVSLTGSPGPLTALAQLPLKTDQSGNLIVTEDTAGTPGDIDSLANLRGRVDGAGALLVAEGP